MSCEPTGSIAFEAKFSANTSTKPSRPSKVPCRILQISTIIRSDAYEKRCFLLYFISPGDSGASCLGDCGNIDHGSLAIRRYARRGSSTWESIWCRILRAHRTEL